MGGFTKQTIKDIDIAGKRVLVRVDYNVPLSSTGVVNDNYRMTESLATINYLIDQGCKVVLMSHLGRPEGKNVASLSLAPVARELQKLLPKQEVIFVKDCIGEDTQKVIKKMTTKQIILLENTRFHKGDEDNSDEFAQQLAKNGKIFVQDCFGVAHRSHASVTGVAKILPSAAGFLLEKEVSKITQVMSNPDKPVLTIIGGAKISDKLPLLEKFIDIADRVAIVGAMANTFLLAQGYEVGSSLVEQDKIELAREIIAKAEAKKGFEFYIPVDVVVSSDIDGTKTTRIVDLRSHSYADILSYPNKPKTSSFSLNENEQILDIGPMSSNYIAGLCSLAKTVIWNGTAGVTETQGLAGASDPFSHGSTTIANALSDSTAFTLAGGGDTVGFIESLPGLRESLGHVSTGGGASMELMMGSELPGVSVLPDKQTKETNE